MLTEKELKKYSRQIAFDKIGKKGQERLKKSKVAIVGLGGIGSITSLYLASVGINLRLIDKDIVALSDLHRQVLYDEADIGKPKSIVAGERLRKRNSDIDIESFHEEFNTSTAERLVKGVDVVLDANDNMETRFLLNDVCIKNKIPFTYAAAIQDRVMFSFIIPGKTACLRCILQKIPDRLENPEEVGIIGVTPGFVGLLSALEVIKYIVGFGKPLTNKLLFVNLSDFKLDVIKTVRNKNCKTCVRKEFEFLNNK